MLFINSLWDYHLPVLCTHTFMGICIILTEQQLVLDPFLLRMDFRLVRICFVFFALNFKPVINGYFCAIQDLEFSSLAFY